MTHARLPSRVVIAVAFAIGAAFPARAQIAWTNYTSGGGLGDNFVRGVYAAGSTLYAATDGGLSVSTNNGTNWTTYTTGSGLGDNVVYGVYASGGTICAATNGGLSVGIEAVPEPSTYAMAFADLACGGYLVRRRRKRAYHAPASLIPTRGGQFAITGRLPSMFSRQAQ